MTVELTKSEAEILIAVLTFAEGAALVVNPSIVAALAELRPWRSALLLTYLRDGLTGGNQPAMEPAKTTTASEALGNSSSSSDAIASMAGEQ